MSDSARMQPLEEILLIVSPALAFVACALLAFAIFWFGPRRRVTVHRRSSTAVLPSVFVDFAYWLLDPLVGRLARAGATPNQITMFSLLLSIAAGVSIARGAFAPASWLLLTTAFCDVVDGHLARTTGTTSVTGAFLDSFVDRMAEAAIFAGMAVYGQGGLLTWLAFAALAASLLISYARAKVEALGGRLDGGLMQRPERFFVIIVSVSLAPIAAVFLEPGAERPVYHVVLAGMALLVALSSWTVIERTIGGMKAVAGLSGGGDTPTSGGSSRPLEPRDAH